MGFGIRKLGHKVKCGPAVRVRDRDRVGGKVSAFYSLSHLHPTNARCRVKCGVRDAGKVWKSKVLGIRCGAKVRGYV